MARIDLSLSHAYGEQPRRDEDYALRPLTMTFEDGGAYALLGPSGCGKTTMLNIISGLLTPSHGAVRFDGEDVTLHTPQARNIAQVFQFPVVYDTMTVAENLAFPLRNRGVRAMRVRERVGQIAEMLDLNAELDKRAAGLSADARQRISLGRGLVRDDVSAVLFDEPLTVIDPQLKWQLRRKLKQIHAELKLTLIYVTHDQVEALTFAERIVVMMQGRIVQVGSASALYRHPSHPFVGYFIGSPGMNFLPARVDACALVIAGQRVRLPLTTADARSSTTTGFPSDEFVLGIRPEYVSIVEPHATGAIGARVVQLQDLGTYTMVTVRVGDGAQALIMRARVNADVVVPAEGEVVWLTVVTDRSCVFAGAQLVELERMATV